MRHGMAHLEPRVAQCGSGFELGCTIHIPRAIDEFSPMYKLLGFDLLDSR